LSANTPHNEKPFVPPAEKSSGQISEKNLRPLQNSAVSNQPDIGERLREIRKRRRLSLQKVAQGADVSTSWLSRIENGQTNVPYDTLKRVCNALEISLEDVIQPEHRNYSSGRRTITKIGETVPFNSGQYAYLAHSSELSHKTMVPLELVVKARSRDEFDHWSSHEGEEFVYVISGAIEVHSEVYEPSRLDAGESAYFDSGMGHIYICVSEDDAHILSVSYDPQRGRGRIETFLNPEVKVALVTDD
jgi:transcriptional regulator with XRE-family HTH domain